jgi:hypothetical protein
MWILILTLLSSTGVAVTSVSSFTSRDTCIKAGELWRSTVDNQHRLSYAVCVPA